MLAGLAAAAAVGAVVATDVAADAVVGFGAAVAAAGAVVAAGGVVGLGAAVGAVVGAAGAGLLHAAARPSSTMPPAAVDRCKKARRETRSSEEVCSDNSVSPSV